MALPKRLQIYNLKRRCRDLNPEKDCAVIDYESYVDPTLTYWENVENLKEAYPGYKWEEKKLAEKEREMLAEELEHLEERTTELRKKLHMPLKKEQLKECYSKLDKYEKELDTITKKLEEIKEREKEEEKKEKITPKVEELEVSKYKGLPEREFKDILNTIHKFDSPRELERFHRGLKTDKLPRATPNQRKRIYAVFKKKYKAVGGEKDILNKENWLHPGEAHGVSDQEMEYIRYRIDKIDNIEDLEDYWEYLEENVIPRASPKKAKEISVKFNNRLRELKKIIKKEIRRKREKIEIELEVGDKVEKDGMKGTVVDIGMREVKVDWEVGGESWEKPKKLEKVG